MKVDTVVLAGGEGAVLDPACRFKGLLDLAGKPMVEWVVDALREAGLIEGLAVVVPTAEDLGSWVDKVDKVVVSDGNIMDNVLAGIESFRVDRPVLLTTGDIPLLDPHELDAFLRDSLATGAEFTYPVIPERQMVGAFPDGERTFLKFVEGRVTGGNMVLVNPALVEKNKEFGQSMFGARKSPVSQARMLGLGFVARFVAGRLTIADVERKVESLLGGTCRAVYTKGASIGMDVDKPADARLVGRILATRGKRGPGTATGE